MLGKKTAAPNIKTPPQRTPSGLLLGQMCDNESMETSAAAAGLPGAEEPLGLLAPESGGVSAAKGVSKNTDKPQGNRAYGSASIDETRTGGAALSTLGPKHVSQSVSFFFDRLLF